MSLWKRILASIGIVLVITLMVLTMLVCVARSSRVQTAAVSVLAEQLSRAFGTRVEVGTVNYEFPNRLFISDVFMEDHQHDTLLKVDTLSAYADMWKLIAEDTLMIHEITLSGATSHLYHTDRIVGDDTLSVANYQFLIDAFRTQEEREPLALNIRIDRINLARMNMRYDDWHASIPAATLHLKDISKSHIDAEIADLSGVIDRSLAGLPPLEIKELEAHTYITDSIFSFPKLHIALPNSDIRATELALDHGQIAVKVSKATVTPSDLAGIVPQLRSMNAPIEFSADITGNIDSIEAQGLDLKYRNVSLFRGNASVKGLSSINERLAAIAVNPDSTIDNRLYLRAHSEDFAFSSATLQDILSSVKGTPVQLPPMVARLGKMHYRGDLEGRLDNLTLHGNLTTELGSVKTEGWASIPEELNDITYKGMLSTRQFELGRLLENSDLGAIAVTVTTDGHLAQGQHFHGNVCANLDYLEFRRYTYKNIHLDGFFENLMFTGDCHSSDPNLAFKMNSKVDATGDAPTYRINLNLQHFRPGALHLTDKYADMDLRTNLFADLRGASIDELAGQVKISNFLLSRPAIGENLPMENFVLSLSHDAASRSVRIYSDYLTLTMEGKYLLSTLPVSLQKVLIEALPSAYPLGKMQEIMHTPSSNRLTYNIYSHHLDQITRIFELPVHVTDIATIKGELNDSQHSFSLGAMVPQILLKEQKITAIDISASTTQNQPLELAMRATAIRSNSIAGDHIGDMMIYLNAQAESDSLNLHANWKNINTDTIHHAGDIVVRTQLSRLHDKPVIAAQLQPSNILLADSAWQLAPSQITYVAADTSIKVNHFRFASASQSLYANGVASRHMSDSLRIELESIDIDYFLGALTNVHNAIQFGGRVSGWATAYGILKAPRFEASVEMLDASINKSLVGDVYATAHLDNRNRVVINGEAYDRRLPSSSYKPTVVVDGLVGGPNMNWELNIRPDSVEIGLVNHWVNSFLTNLGGRASGHVRVWGERKPKEKEGHVWVTVRAKGENAHFTVPFNGATYYLNDSVILDSAAVIIPKQTLRDVDGNPLSVEGKVTHNGEWKNIRYQVDVDARKALILDIPTEGEELYSGHVYGNGTVRVTGTETECHIDATATTTGGNFVFSVAGASSATDHHFIQFVDHRKKEETVQQAATVNIQPEFFYDLALRVNATPEAECTVLIDKRTGDCLKGRGEGDIRLHLSNNDLSMHGTYTLQQGTFGFTFQNVIRRDFQIDNGSSVTWSGNAENPTLDVRALYKVTASLRDLFGTDLADITSRSSVPVNCVVNLTDHLNTPIINFGIELPSSDESVLSQVRSVINTEEMITRQVLYLLIFSRFYTPEYMRQTSNVGVNETYSLISSTVTGQINSWLSRLTDMVSVGFNVRADGEGSDASQEYEAQFEIHPVRGLLINGNFGYRYNDIANQPVFGNLDVEYMLTSNGKFRIKGYTHTVDKYSLKQANTVQGVGFVFKHDFNIPTAEERQARKEQREANRLARKAKREQKQAEREEARISNMIEQNIR